MPSAVPSCFTLSAQHADQEHCILHPFMLAHNVVTDLQIMSTSELQSLQCYSLAHAVVQQFCIQCQLCAGCGPVCIAVIALT